MAVLFLCKISRIIVAAVYGLEEYVRLTEVRPLMVEGK